MGKQSTKSLRLALRLEHLVPLLSAPETLDTFCVHLGREQLVSLPLFLCGTLVFDRLNFPLEQTVRNNSRNVIKSLMSSGKIAARP